LAKKRNKSLADPTQLKPVDKVDAAGASIGCLGLAGFALVFWRCLPKLETWEVGVVATFVWLLLSIAFWLVRKSRFLHTTRGQGIKLEQAK
jgi:hypothetical protein